MPTLDEWHALLAAAGEPDFVKEEKTMPKGHNSGDETVASDELRPLIERVERLAEERKGINDDIRDVFAEGKARGYDPKMMRQIVRERAMDKNHRDEKYALEETYREAMGLMS